jgi:serine/threonine protein kinase
MSLSAGVRLGPYEIVAPLGKGGMGEVYRARDTKLGRDVAIKVLPTSVASDAERARRFEREARLLAALSHPHIGAIHGLENAAGTPLILELVEGPTLADRLVAGPLSLQEALSLARQIADALEAAHENGIIHRDLKPANIKVRFDGVVKVLDFGLAKAFVGDGPDVDLAQLPTVTINGTVEGLIAGTPAYMSPEQATCQAIDKRSDIWAFGCVLYEMLTGRKAFSADTVSGILAEVREREPDWQALERNAPPSITKLTRRCLEKDAKRRLRDIGDARIELDDADIAKATGSSNPRPTTRYWPAALATIVVVAILAAVVAMTRPRVPPEPGAAETATLSVDIPTSTTIGNSPPAVSPDGRQVAWVASSTDGRTRIWTEALAAGVPRELVGTESGADPFWSPDGRSIGFRMGGQMKRIEIATGAIQSIATVPDVSSGATWSAENVIVFAARYALFAVPASGGTPTSVATLNRERQENQLQYPQFLPDNRHFLYVARSGRSGQSGAYVGSLDGRPPTRLFSTTSFVRYAPPGHLLSVREGALVAQSFNPVTLAVGSEATTIVQHVTAIGPLNSRFDVSETGLLAFFARSSAPDELLRWFDRGGNALGDLTEAGRYAYFRIGRDGRRVVVDRGPTATGGRSVWVYDTDGRPPYARHVWGSRRMASGVGHGCTNRNVHVLPRRSW